MSSPTDPEKARREQQKASGVNALNRDFSRFDQVNKAQSYRLSEAEGAEAFDDDYQIRSVDFTLWREGGVEGRKRFSQEIGRAMEEIGFVVLTGHGIDPQLYEQAERQVVDLFENTRRDQRMRFEAQRHGSVNQGYFPITETTIIHPDLVEGWVFCRRAFNLDEDPTFDAAAFWPRPADEPVFRQVIEAQEPLILPIMQSILMYLGCDPHLYDEPLTGTNFGFRLNYYPAMSEATESGGRMLGHEDVDLFTFLPAPKVEGLQVLNRTNMKWVRLNPPPGSIIINTGDYMQRITNDRLPSTTHRVARPRSPELLSEPRVSIPMAIYVWEDHTLEVLPGLGEPRYDPIKAITFHTKTTAKYYGEDYAVDSE